MNIGFVGGVLERSLPVLASWDPDSSWAWTVGERTLFLQSRGTGCHLFARGPHVLMIRGHIVDTWSRHPHQRDLLADRLHRFYWDHGSLTLEGLEGTFTLAFLDGQTGLILLYRNLVGNGHTYHVSQPNQWLFSSNLATLVSLSGQSPQPADDLLPTFFLYRNVPGKRTLFRGFERLLPGEQIQHQRGSIRLTLRRTFGDLHEARSINTDALDRLDDTMTQLCSEYAELDPSSCNLLSGGVDSSYLQAHWNRLHPPVESIPSFSISVDHPRTIPDSTYALSASQRLGTHHTYVSADDNYSTYLLDVLRCSGEMPNHVQLAYFAELGRSMSQHGIKTALSAEAADSLVGLATANRLQNAAFLRRLFPHSWVRRSARNFFHQIGGIKLSAYFDLAEHLYDFSYLSHPVNHSAVFADWSTVEACFGRDAVAEVTANRRDMLDEYHVPLAPLDRLHAAGYLGSAVNTASLTTTLLNHAGVAVQCPFLDSRMLRLILNLSPRQRFPFRRPKELLKRSLSRHGYPDLAYRKKLGFGQPIFEWLSAGGPLRPLVDAIQPYDFLPPGVLESLKQKPTWFLYSLLCYDLWYKMFISNRAQFHSPLPYSLVG